MKIRSPFRRVARFVRLSSVCAAGAVCAALAFSSVATADIIPYGISGVAGYSGANADSTSPTEPNQVMNGAAITVVNPLNSTTWSADDNWQHGWQQSNTSGATNQNWIGADLGSVHSNLADIVIWNTREVTDRGSQSVNVYYATSPTASLASLDGTGSTFASSAGWTLLGNYVIPQSPPTTPGTAGNGSGPDLFINVHGITARDFAFQIESNYGSNIRQGFAGIQFTTPEPASVVLLGLGIAGVGLAVRRRRDA